MGKCNLRLLSFARLHCLREVDLQKFLCAFLRQRILIGFIAAAIALVARHHPAFAADGCNPGSRCLPVTTSGKPAPDPAPFVAQCTGKFADYVVVSSYLSANYKGPWFVLSQNYPVAVPTDQYPWLTIDFDKADDYLAALRKYSFEGMIDADFRPENNKVRPWFHMPLMNDGPLRREPIRGLTEERSISGPELGVKPGTTIHNYAIGFYNGAGATTIGKIWQNSIPDISAVRFPEGTMSFKILFSAATQDDFSDPAADPMTGAPEFQVMTGAGITTVRLIQMDVAAVDKRSPTGWVFGTFAFDKTAADPVAWNRLRPVGMSWANDPNYTPADQAAGKPLTESRISSQIPPFAKSHLGYAGRPNGPVDNPVSGCLSCHGTAEYPVAADIAPFKASCDTNAKKLFWFRDFLGNVPFGAVNGQTCEPETPQAPLQTLDFSLQVKVAVQNVLQLKAANPCDPASHHLLEAVAVTPYQDAPRVGR
jgi:hypothetical protein